MMNNDFLSEIELIASGVEYGHKGCANHISHPCEGCGRTAASGIFMKYKNIPFFLIGKDSKPFIIPLIKL